MNKAELLGQAVKSKPTGNHKPVLRKLNEAEELSQGIAIFCTGCGRTRGTDPEGLKKFARILELQVPDTTDKYISVKRCLSCHDRFSDAEFKDKPKS